MLSVLNNYKHLPPKEFDALLGKLLKAKADERKRIVQPAVKLVKKPAKKKW